MKSSNGHLVEDIPSRRVTSDVMVGLTKTIQDADIVVVYRPLYKYICIERST